MLPSRLTPARFRTSRPPPFQPPVDLSLDSSTRLRPLTTVHPLHPSSILSSFSIYHPSALRSPLLPPSLTFLCRLISGHWSRSDEGLNSGGFGPLRRNKALKPQAAGDGAWFPFRRSGWFVLGSSRSNTVRRIGGCFGWTF